MGGYLIDVACGSGRLAIPLSGQHHGRYLGIDVVPRLLEHASKAAKRPAWRFEVAEGFRIPEADAAADMVCFFSVFTHLLHEQPYCYLRDAKRVLKPGGKIVFTFLEFAVWSHWSVFEMDLERMDTSHVHNQFMSRDLINSWAQHLDLEVEEITSGDKPQIPVEGPPVAEISRPEEGTLGQSLAVLRSRAKPRPAAGPRPGRPARTTPGRPSGRGRAG